MSLTCSITAGTKPWLRILVRNFMTLDDKDICESFIRGSGPGGQKINKTSSTVQLTHIPTGITVKCQAFREQLANRKHARTILRDKVDLFMNGGASRLGMQIAKRQKSKQKKAQRTSKKYGSTPSETTS